MNVLMARWQLRVDATVAVTGRAGGERGETHCILYLANPEKEDLCNVVTDWY